MLRRLLHDCQLTICTNQPYKGTMQSHRAIITRFGGIRAMARKLGHRNHTTVQGWWLNSIPVHRWQEVATAAVENGIDFDMAELMPEAA